MDIMNRVSTREYADRRVAEYFESGKFYTKDNDEIIIEPIDLQMAVEIYNADGFGGLYGNAPRFIPVEYLVDRFLECKQLPTASTKICP